MTTRGSRYSRRKEGSRRAVRRAHYNRLKRKRSRYWWFQSWGPGELLTADRDKMLGLLTETPKCCSCIMCGNPRKHYNELTKQEILADLGEDYE
jgi:hypothetical protein